MKAFVFDDYGTIYDIHSVIDACNKLFPDKGEKISEDWREKSWNTAFSDS